MRSSTRDANAAAGGKLLVCLCGLLLSAPPPLDAGERLTIAVSPRVSFAPADLYVRLGVQPHTDNRVLEIIAETAQFYRSSQIQLDGSLAPRTFVVEFRSLPSGDYEVRGIVTDRIGRELAFARMHVTVVPSAAGR